MAVRTCALVALLALGSAPALAQDGGIDDAGASDAGLDEGDAGDSDAGAVDCVPVCEGDVLRFCDDGEPVELDCGEEGGTCGLVSEEWGFDCLLPEGAACEPGYAEGISRCEGSGEADLCCVEGACAEPGNVTSCRQFQPEAPSRPAIANPVADNTGAQSCLGLGGCEGIPGLSLLPLLVGLRLRRRRR